VQYANPHPRQFPPEDQFILSWQFGVMGTISITSLKAAGPELERIDGVFQELDNRRETLIKTISLQIKRDLLEIEKSRQLLEASATILAQARENYDIVYSKFLSGSAVNTDILSAQQELLQAQLERTRAYTVLRRAESQLVFDAGYDAGYGDDE
jgi:outer membrane protein TolC